MIDTSHGIVIDEDDHCYADPEIWDGGEHARLELVEVLHQSRCGTITIDHAIAEQIAMAFDWLIPGTEPAVEIDQLLHASMCGMVTIDHDAIEAIAIRHWGHAL